MTLRKAEKLSEWCPNWLKKIFKTGNWVLRNSSESQIND